MSNLRKNPFPEIFGFAVGFSYEVPSNRRRIRGYNTHRKFMSDNQRVRDSFCDRQSVGSSPGNCVNKRIIEVSA